MWPGGWTCHGSSFNYHLKELEAVRLVELVEERKKGNCIERLMRATARSYLISPAAVGKLAADLAAIADKLSASYLVAVAARAIKEIAMLRRRADKAGKTLATLTLESEIRFRSAEDRAAFSQELAADVARLILKYNDDHAEFRLFTGAYPLVTKTEEEEQL